jgi:hypothetical protein
MSDWGWFEGREERNSVSPVLSRFNWYLWQFVYLSGVNRCPLMAFKPVVDVLG